MRKDTSFTGTTLGTILFQVEEAMFGVHSKAKSQLSLQVETEEHKQVSNEDDRPDACAHLPCSWRPNNT